MVCFKTDEPSDQGQQGKRSEAGASIQIPGVSGQCYSPDGVR